MRTVRAACDYGFDCTVIADACATKDLTFHDKTISAEHVQAAFFSIFRWMVWESADN